MLLPRWIINQYGGIEERDVMLQKELIRISTQKNGLQLQRLWIHKDRPVSYSVLWNIKESF